MTAAFSRTQHGLLELTFDVWQGRTRLLKDRQQNPLKVVRPFETEDGGLLLYVINPTAGVLGGDRFEIRLELHPGTKVVLLSQSAQKIHRMNPDEHAVQYLQAHIAKGARLEVYPERVIPFAGSNFSQDSRFILEEDAEMGLLESFSSGRVAHGEHWGFERLAAQTKVMQGGRLVYLDRFDLHPKEQNLEGLGAMQGGHYWASGLFVGKTLEPLSTPLTSGVTAYGHVWLRGVERSGLVLDTAIHQTINHLRCTAFGVGPLRVRR